MASSSSTSTDSSLLSKLESCNSTTPIFSLFSSYLRPLSDLKNPHDKTLIRSLAKKFLSFLNKSLSILPKRISNANAHSKDEKLVSELFDVYRLCLNCLDLVSSQLAGKPYSIQLQRMRLVRCLEAWEKYEDTESEGVRVLEGLRSVDFDGKSCDAEFALVFVEVVVVMVKCAAMRQRKDGEVYRRVLGLVEEARHWFRVLDANAYEKLHRVLVSYLGKCTHFLVGELMHFNGNFVSEFCLATMTEYAKASMKNQIYKFSRWICASLFSLKENKHSVIIEIILCVLDSVASHCKVELGNSGIELVELVSYCAYKCRATCTFFCGTVAGHLDNIAGDLPQVMTPVDLILRLYAAGLYFTNYGTGGDLTSSRGAKKEFAIRILLNDEDRLHKLATLLGSLGSYFSVCCKENCVSSRVEYEGSFSQICLPTNSNHEASTITLMQKNREDFMLSYLNALKFLCQPLAEQINSEKKEIVSEIESTPGHEQLCSIQDAFYQLSDAFLFWHSYTSERDKDGFDDNKTVLTVTVAAFILSIRTNCKMKKSSRLIKNIIASEWIEPQGLKYVYASLYNIGVSLYKNKQVKENFVWYPFLKLLMLAAAARIEYKINLLASKFQISCRASWTCVVLLAQLFIQKSGMHKKCFPFGGSPSSGSHKVKKVIVESLEIGLLLHLFRVLPGPMPLVKNWVKIVCKLRENVDVEMLLHLYTNDMYEDICRRETLLCHLLAVAYCLRALCTQEAEPNSKQVIKDIDSALNQWLTISICSTNDECNIVTENTMLLLYNVGDLLSVKGCMEIHNVLYKLMIRFLKWKNVPLEKCLSIFWESRRLSHALCISPVNEGFLMNLAEQCGEISKSIDFWVCCLKESQPLVVGFQQNLSLLFADICESPNQPYITIADVKEAASELISSVSLPPRSVFLVGYLYYDLCERLTAKGQLFEALSYAKEAHRLRTQLFQEKFSYSSDRQVEKHEAGDLMQKLTYACKDFQVTRSITSQVWSFDVTSWNVDDCYLSPWNVLQCYLESTLQVGIVHELVGNGTEAESFLLWGKSISYLQSLPLFIVAFSSVLGKLYRKKQHWDLAEKELKSAKQILVESGKNFSCSKCRLMLEVTVDQQLGDLSRSLFDGATGNTSMERLSHAENIYKSALDKLNLSEWKNSISFPEGESSENTMEILTRDGSVAKMEGKKSRKLKNAPTTLLKDQSLIPESNSRITRSKYRSSQNQCVNGSIEVQAGLSKHTKGNTSSDFSNPLSQRESVLETKSCIVDTGCEATCICNKMKCWKCLRVEVIESGLLDNFVHIKWEFIRRRLSLRVLTGIGKCLGNHDQVHEAHEIISQSLSVLFSGNSFCHTHSSLPPTFLLDLIGKEYSGDVFAVERAAVLYNICWLSLKDYHSTKTRNICCDLSHIQLQKIVPWLMIAFVLCREVPILFQKVSRLLAVVFIFSSSSKLFSLSSSCKVLSESHWASFFHQASLGTHLNYQFLSNISCRYKGQLLLDVESTHVTSSSHIGAETSNLLSFAPESMKDLEQFVKDFFVGLPCATVMCVTLLEGAYASLLQELLLFPSPVHAWMLLSRLNSKSQPIVVLLPVNTVLEEASDDDNNANFGFEELYESNDCGKHWHCPWGSTVVDDVAPAFQSILKESYLMSFPQDTERNRSLWWMQRKKLDHRLGELLRKVEDSWLGHWKYMFLGEWSNCKNLDKILKKLARDLKIKCKVDVNESLLRVVLGGLKSGYKREENMAQLFSKKGCCIGTFGYYDNNNCRRSSKVSNGVDKLSELAFQLIDEALKELEAEESVNREPTILVLDCEVQMLPWENIPILRKEEVYRMPSVGSIFVALERIHHQEQVRKLVATFPKIDPLDAFYLLNPSGDLSYTQVKFEDWFRDQNLEGKAGSAPTAEELAVALKNHDLYIYFGHGSGSQYIKWHHVQKLEKCAATLLMGCSSGSLSLNGCYAPSGTPLSYLQAGSPVIFANLWDVTDKDIDRFAKAMLDGWLRERSNVSVDSDQSISVVEEHDPKNETGKGNKKKISRKKPPESSGNGTCKSGHDHRPKLGSFMGQARNACQLPFLIGASPVCYGVPTGIRRKTSL
ncbi:separase [Pistacia vera]|uniref:separase n=1 Tax=Pistacia vera TaxID=55513 RepID=UPI001262BCF3|nr:separase [Pistacia vera]